MTDYMVTFECECEADTPEAAVLLVMKWLQELVSENGWQFVVGGGEAPAVAVTVKAGYVPGLVAAKL